jgi:hypothetical protein
VLLADVLLSDVIKRVVADPHPYGFVQAYGVVVIKEDVVEYVTEYDELNSVPVVCVRPVLDVSMVASVLGSSHP